MKMYKVKKRIYGKALENGGTYQTLAYTSYTMIFLWMKNFS